MAIELGKEQRAQAAGLIEGAEVTPTRRAEALQIAKAGATYFACVFGAGFALGSVRVPLLVPRLGVRVAELAEMPLMFCAIVLAARWTVLRFALPPTPAARLGAGAVALALLRSAEFTLALWLQGLTVEGYLSSRDPVSGSAYAAMLLVFAAMPLWVRRERPA
jgi:hypothetical protein